MSTVQLIKPTRFGDARGWFTEVYAEQRFAALGIEQRFVQENHSLSVPRFTLRGLHCQTPPNAQAKLVRCIRGRVYDVSVDIRSGSPTYGQWTGTELSSDNGHQLFIPVGFAHAFLTLQDHCEIVYKVTAPYAPACELGIRWDSVGIDWPLPTATTPILSPRDAALPTLAEFSSPFVYEGFPLIPLA